MLNLNISALNMPSLSFSFDISNQVSNIGKLTLHGLTPTASLQNMVANCGNIKIATLQASYFIDKSDATFSRYLSALTSNIKYPLHKIETLREDETIDKSLDNILINNSGSVTISNEMGVQRTANFTVVNNEEALSYFKGLTLGHKFKISLGENIDGYIKYFQQGVFLFDNPSINKANSDNSISFTGTDKWSLLNGQHSGILEYSYVVTKGTKLGDFIRRTLRLNIVNDNVEPNINPDIENLEITYEIVKDEGATIADMLIDIGTNLNVKMYYDEFGRFTAVPIVEDIYSTIACVFSDDTIPFISASKTDDLTGIYNSVLVVSDNVDSSLPPIRYELENNDMSDPNAIDNCGFKKVYMVKDYLQGIDSLEKAIVRTRYELRKIRKQYSDIKIESVGLYHLSVGDIIMVYNDDLSLKGEKFVINSISRTIGTDIIVSIDASIVRDG